MPSGQSISNYVPSLFFTKRMAQDIFPVIYCVYGPHKEINEGTCGKFIRTREPLNRIKEVLKANDEPNRISSSWANTFENVYYSEDGEYWICKLCVEEKDHGQRLKGMHSCPFPI